jgi:signal transduction histidine kinase
VPASRERPETALNCLLDNAVKFTRPGDAITGTGLAGEHDWVVEVADTGVGLVPHDAAALTAAQPVTRSEASGTGLGLATVRTTAGAWGGTVHITSHPHASP